MSDERPNPYRMSDDPLPASPTAGPRPRGCLFWGCLGLAGLVVFMTTCTLGGAYLGIRHIRDNYTADQPVPLTPIVLTAEETRAVRDQFDAFRKDVDEGTADRPFSLSIDEVNALIAEENEGTRLTQSVRFRIEDDQLKGEISMPLEGFPGLGGRYLNGTADVNFAFADGELEVHLDTIAIDGQPLPEAFMTEMRASNLAEGVMREPEARATLRRLESIEIKDGKVVIEPRIASAPSAGP